MANLTIRGLDETIKASLRVEAAKQGLSMEEAARQILRRAVMGPGAESGGLGTRIHEHFRESGGVDLVLPERSTPRAAPDFRERATSRKA